MKFNVTLQIILLMFALQRFNRADKTKTCILNIEHEFEHGTRQWFSRRTPLACQSSLSATFPQPSVFPRSFDTSLRTRGEATVKSPPINIYAMLLTGRSLLSFLSLSPSKIQFSLSHGAPSHWRERN